MILGFVAKELGMLDTSDPILGSIGIIGVALVPAFSNGFNLYIEKLQKDTLSTYPITISESSIDMTAVSSIMANASDKEYPEFNKIIVNNK